MGHWRIKDTYKRTNKCHLTAQMVATEQHLTNLQRIAERTRHDHYSTDGIISSRQDPSENNLDDRYFIGDAGTALKFGNWLEAL